MDYAALQASALSLLQQMGTKVSLTSYQTGSKLSTYGVFEKIKQDDTGAMATDVRTVILPGSIKTAPQIGDHLTINSVSYYIQGVEIQNPTGKPLYYRVKVIA